MLLTNADLNSSNSTGGSALEGYVVIAPGTGYGKYALSLYLALCWPCLLLSARRL